MKQKVIIALSFIFVLTACGVLVEKRRYNKGFHVQWNKKSPSAKKSEKKRNDDRQNETFAHNHIVPKTSFTESTDESEVQNFFDNPIENIETTHSRQNYSWNNESEENSKIKPKQLSIAKENSNSSLRKKSNKNKDYLLYGLTTLLAIATFGLVRLNKGRTLRTTKWAHKNKRGAKALIFTGQVTVGFLGFSVGEDMHQLGIDFSNNTQYALSGLAVVGGGYLYLKERKINALFTSWKSFFRNKFAHVLIGASLFSVFASIGNNIESNNVQVTPAGYVISNLVQSKNSSDYQLSESKIKNEGRASAGAIIGAVLLAILILGLTALAACALACEGHGVFAIAAAILGILITVLVVNALVGKNKKHSN